VDHELSALIKHDNLLDCPQIDSKATLASSQYVQPASIDVPLTAECYLVKDRVLPYGKKLRELLPSLEIMRINLSSQENGAILLKGQTYLAYCGRVKMPAECRGSLSPKSSIGRVDLMVRGVFDGSGLYDSIGKGEEGELWMEISPRSFNVRVRERQALSQMMVFVDDDEKISGIVHSNKNDQHVVPPLLFTKDGVPIDPPLLHHDGSVILHLGLRLGEDGESEEIVSQESIDGLEENASQTSTGVSATSPTRKAPTATKRLRSAEKRKRDSYVVGWEALATSDVVDLSLPNAHPASRFFRPIMSSQCRDSGKSKITLEKDRFYILATKERISVPTSLSAEMIPFSHHIGELRAHYAGFFDPGFGYGKDGSIKGTVGVLEVRPHETITIFDGQPICLIEYFRNTSIPAVSYGDAGNSYQNQKGAKLAKYFYLEDDECVGN